MLSDEWFMNQFMEVKQRLTKIETNLQSGAIKHTDDINIIDGRLKKVEQSCQSGEVIDKNWKYWTKLSGKIVAILSVLTYIVVDVYNKMTGKG